MTRFVLLAQKSGPRPRILIDTEEPGDDRLQALSQLLEASGIRQLSTSHQCHAVAGPEHPHFEAALSAYGLTWRKPCDDKIITKAIELLIDAELLEVDALEDDCLRGLLASGFSAEDDWENRGEVAEVTVRTHLANHYEGFKMDPTQMDANHLTAYSALVGGMMVAVTKARADWTP